MGREMMLGCIAGVLDWVLWSIVLVVGLLVAVAGLLVLPWYV